MRRGFKVFTSTVLAMAMIAGLGACGKTQGDVATTEEASEDATASVAVASVDEVEGNILKNG